MIGIESSSFVPGSRYVPSNGRCMHHLLQRSSLYAQAHTFLVSNSRAYKNKETLIFIIKLWSNFLPIEWLNEIANLKWLLVLPHLQCDQWWNEATRAIRLVLEMRCNDPLKHTLPICAFLLTKWLLHCLIQCKSLLTKHYIEIHVLFHR